MRSEDNSMLLTKKNLVKEFSVRFQACFIRHERLHGCKCSINMV